MRKLGSGKFFFFEKVPKCDAYAPISFKGHSGMKTGRFYSGYGVIL